MTQEIVVVLEPELPEIEVLFSEVGLVGLRGLQGIPGDITPEFTALSEQIYADALATEIARVASVVAKTGSETARTESETARAGSETAQTAAQNSQIAANNSAISADASEEEATAQAVISTTQAGGATTAALSAGTSATVSQTAREGSETARVASEAAREASQIARTGSEIARDGSVVARTGAETAQTAAQTSQIGAGTSATAAATSATAAQTAQGLADTSATNAASSSDAAVVARTGSEVARDASVVAQNAAASSAANAETSFLTAEAAADVAESATQTLVLWNETTLVYDVPPGDQRLMFYGPVSPHDLGLMSIGDSWWNTDPAASVVGDLTPVIANHVAMPDPHTQYQLEVSRGGGSSTAGMIDSRLPLFTAIQSTLTKTGAVVVELSNFPGSTMVTVEVDIHTYSNGYQRSRVTASLYGSPTTLHNFSAKVEHITGFPAGFAGLATPSISWARNDTDKVYLIIGTDASSWNVSSAQINRVTQAYNTTTVVTAAAPVYMATLPADIAIAVPVLAVQVSDSLVIGIGSPEQVVQASVGMRYRDNSATNGAIEWIKASGTNTITGWKVVYGDTGWRNLHSWDTAGNPTLGTPALPNPTAFGPRAATAGGVRVRRVGSVVSVSAHGFQVNTTGADPFLVTLALGFRPGYPARIAIEGYPSAGGNKILSMGITTTGLVSRSSNFATFVVGDGILDAHWSFFTDNAWPTTLPGIAG